MHLNTFQLAIFDPTDGRENFVCEWVLYVHVCLSIITVQNAMIDRMLVNHKQTAPL